jgi:hypothetical protein
VSSLIAVAMVAASALMVVTRVSAAAAVFESPVLADPVVPRVVRSVPSLASTAAMDWPRVARSAFTAASGEGPVACGGSLDDVIFCSAITRCWTAPRAVLMADTPLDTAASAAPRAAADLAGAFPVMVFGLTASTITDALGIVALAVFMVKVKLFVNGPAGSNSDAAHRTNTVGVVGDREEPGALKLVACFGTVRYSEAMIGMGVDSVMCCCWPLKPSKQH